MKDRRLRHNVAKPSLPANPEQSLSSAFYAPEQDLCHTRDDVLSPSSTKVFLPMSDNVLRGLVKKSAELSGDIETTQVKLRCGVTLRGQRDNGVASSAQGLGMSVLWQLAK